MWISDAISKGLVFPSRAANHSGDSEAATDWLRQYYDQIPDDIRPRKTSIREYAAFFSTYLTSSFEIAENPGTKGEGPSFGCTCCVCVRIVNAPHLRTKKLYARDKRHAETLLSEAVVRVAQETKSVSMTT